MVSLSGIHRVRVDRRGAAGERTLGATTAPSGEASLEAPSGALLMGAPSGALLTVGGLLCGRKAEGVGSEDDDVGFRF